MHAETHPNSVSRIPLDGLQNADLLFEQVELSMKDLAVVSGSVVARGRATRRSAEGLKFSFICAGGQQYAMESLLRQACKRHHTKLWKR